MGIVARIVFGVVAWAARNGLEPARRSAKAVPPGTARRTGLRGETYAYWYLRRHGYTMIARNFTAPGVRGEIDLIGYDGKVLAFVEVKTRTGESARLGLPEDAVTASKRRHLTRMARQFLAERRIRGAQWRFDVLAIESERGRAPVVRLHKGAFGEREHTDVSGKRYPRGRG